MKIIDFDIKDVHVLLFEIDDNAFEESLRLLNDSDINYINSIKSDKRKKEVAVTLLNIKKVFGKEALLLHNENGKPFLKNISTHISISHSENLLCIAYSDKFDVGIDIQFWKNALIRTTEKFLSNEEQKMLDVALPSIRLSFSQKMLDVKDKNTLLKSWTTKEAAYKILNIKNLSLKDINTINNDVVSVSLPNLKLIKFSSKTLFFDNYCISLVIK